MAGSIFVPIRKKSQDSFIEYYNGIQNFQNISRDTMRERYQYIDRTYQREVLRTVASEKAKAANKRGDSSKYQDITVPIVMPQVESAVTYQTSVFLQEYPLFSAVAGPEYMDAALQLTTALEEQSIRGTWKRELMMSFRDGAKYNFAPMEVCWEEQVTAAVETVNREGQAPTGEAKKVIWSGNKLTRWDPYNTFVDTRVPASEVYKRGEFAGRTQIMSRIELKGFIAALPEKILANIVPAFNSSTASPTTSNTNTQGYFIPEINSDVFSEISNSLNFDWGSWAGMNKASRNMDYKDSYELTTLYARILPEEFDLRIPGGQTPQVYKLHIVNHSVIIYAELQTNAHNMIPVFIGEPQEDGMGYQTKSLATNGTPFQELATSHMSANTASRRKAISDKVLFDPSRILSAHINNDNPSAKVPVRPAAYGSDIKRAVYPFPYRDDQAGTNMQQIQAIIQMGNQLVGQNAVNQGQFIKGNKTNSQFDDVMDNSNGRDQMTSLLYESQIFTPMKEILKLNILQYQGGTTIYNKEEQKQIEIDPVALRKAVMSFKLTDGLTPASKLLKSEAFASAVQVIGSSPEVAGSYNLGPMISYLFKTQGADLSAFEKSPEQTAYEQALGSWQGMMQLAIEKQIDPKVLGLGEQPLPEQFGYDPAKNNPQPPGGDQQQDPQQATQPIA